MDVGQDLFVEQLCRFRVPSVPAMAHINVTWKQVIIDPHSHLGDVGYVLSE